MTPEKAVKWAHGRMLEIVLEQDITTAQAGIDRLNKEYNALSVMVQCTEKEIETKVFNKTLEYDGEYGYCPRCNRILTDFENYRRCPGCGQLVDWR